MLEKRFIFLILIMFVWNPSAVSADQPKTGQSTECEDMPQANPGFTVGTGAEADCVTDNLTGLMWVKSPDSIGRQWDDAVTYARDLSLCGYTDWRLPTKKELSSLKGRNPCDCTVDCSSASFRALCNSLVVGRYNPCDCTHGWYAYDYATWLNTQGFSNVHRTYYYWSSTKAPIVYWPSTKTPILNDPILAVNMGSCGTRDDVSDFWTDVKGSRYLVWPVRSTAKRTKIGKGTIK